MASYKVIQDVEAEDKLLGPLTLRQFIYAGVSAISLYLSYFSATHHATFMLTILLPFAGICGFFAFPWGRDQPTEIWALAKIRYMLKPRRRIWDQSGVKELVSITAPRQAHIDYTNGLSETEVRSRLHALADTIDSRGWAIKNANLNMVSQQALIMSEPTDRLVNAPQRAAEVPDLDIRAGDDMLDEKNNARAQAVDTMIEASAKAHRKQIMENLRQNAPQPEPPKPAGSKNNNAGDSAQQGGGRPGDSNYRSNDYWFLNQPTRSANIPANMVTFNTQVVTPGTNDTMAAPLAAAPAPVMPAAPSPQDEATLVRALDARRQEMPTTAYYSHLHTIQPLSQQQQQAAGQGAMPADNTMPGAGMGMPMPQAGGVAQAVANGMMPAQGLPFPQGQPTTIADQAQQQAAPTQPPVTPAQQAAILQLANNNDLNVATLAREADRAAPDEVVIKLH